MYSRTNRSVNVRCYLNGSGAGKLTAELRDGNRVISTQSVNVSSAAPHHDITLTNLGAIELWGVDHPKLYQIRVSLFDGVNLTDEYETRIGFREARFTPDGFYLNGKHLELRGLNRHQTFPFVGQAMPAGWAGARSITTPMGISVPAIASVITVFRTSFVSRSRRPGFTNRSAIRGRRSFLNPPSTGRAAIATRVSASRWSVQIVNA
ncbi:MAG TPA: hypothetical protein VFS76_16535 [Pyrinomonadaceae bacterium]|nr:hypothetical protein [Pyrinomonadaceae bacterium]